MHTIIRLPNDVFAPYTSITTNILFFDNNGPTEETWFYRVDMPEGYKHFSKTKPMKIEHFADVEKWWNNREEICIDGAYKSKKFTAKELSEDKVSAANGGLMSGFNTDQVDEAFFKAANKLEDGKMTKEPVKDSKGYNVILKVSSAEKPKLETVKDNIIETLAEEKLNASSSAFNDAWYQIRKKYNLDIVDTDVKTLYKANYEK